MNTNNQLLNGENILRKEAYKKGAQCINQYMDIDMDMEMDIDINIDIYIYKYKYRYRYRDP
jgi:hypothetical protein